MAHTHIEAALPVLKRNGVPFLVHAEVVDDREPKASYNKLLLVCQHSTCSGILNSVLGMRSDACNFATLLAMRTTITLPKIQVSAHL